MCWERRPAPLLERLVYGFEFRETHLKLFDTECVTMLKSAKYNNVPNK